MEKKDIISVLGFDIVCGTNTKSNYRRCLWCCVILFCVLLVTIQGVALVSRFYTYPTRIQINVSNNRSMALPAVTVCPATRFDVSRLHSLWVKHFGGRSLESRGPASISPRTPGEVPGVFPLALDVETKYYQLADVVDIVSLWHEITYTSPEELISLCFMGRGNLCHAVGEFKRTLTPAGACFTYTSTLNSISGHFYGLYFRLTSNRIDKTHPLSGWVVSFHEANDRPNLAVARQSVLVTAVMKPATPNSTQNVMKTQFMNAKLSLKQFQRVSTPSRPCTTDGDYSETACEISCLENIVVSRTNCKLPYMLYVTDVPYCNSSSSVQWTERTTKDLIVESFNQQLCTCPLSCQKSVYGYHRDTMSVTNITFARLKMFYDTTLWETIKEDYVYSNVKLICDVGSLLGLLLGASCLTIVEVVDHLVVRIYEALKPTLLKQRP